MSEVKKVVKKQASSSSKKEVGFKEWLAAYKKVNSFDRNFQKKERAEAAKELAELEKKILK